MRILVVEDERKVAQALQSGLEREGYQVVLAASGEEGLALAEAQAFDLVLLDLMLPGRDGLEVLRALRARGLRTPVILLTARDAVEDRVLGLDGGADDYLPKPFAFPELLARMRALLRRGRLDPALHLRLADVELDLVQRRVLRASQPVALTRREFELLELLLRHQGHVVSREMIAEALWKDMARSSTLDNVIDVHIGRLRKKVDEPFPVRLLHTVRGLGFVLAEREP